MGNQIEFIAWNDLKQNLDLKEFKQTTFPDTREVWMCNLGRNIGREQNGRGDSFSRPVLILKKFNNQMYWVVPLSSKQKMLSFYYNFLDPYKKKVSAIIAQLRLVSIKRMQRKMYTMDNAAFRDARKLAREMIS